jgi:hypothetical protein
MGFDSRIKCDNGKMKTQCVTSTMSLGIKMRHFLNSRSGHVARVPARFCRA